MGKLLAFVRKGQGSPTNGLDGLQIYKTHLQEKVLFLLLGKACRTGKCKPFAFHKNHVGISSLVFPKELLWKQLFLTSPTPLQSIVVSWKICSTWPCIISFFLNPKGKCLPMKTFFNRCSAQQCHRCLTACRHHWNWQVLTCFIRYSGELFCWFGLCVQSVEKQDKRMCAMAFLGSKFISSFWRAINKICIFSFGWAQKEVTWSGMYGLSYTVTPNCPRLSFITLGIKWCLTHQHIKINVSMTTASEEFSFPDVIY